MNARINRKFILHIKYIVNHKVRVNADVFCMNIVNNLFRVSKPEFTIAIIFQVHNLSNFVLSAHKICLITGSYVGIFNIVVAWGHHLFLSNIQIKWIIIDHAKKINKEIKKLSLFHNSIFFVIISIIIIEKIQKTGLNQYTIKYRTDARFHCLSGCKNLFNFLKSSNHLFIIYSCILKHTSHYKFLLKSCNKLVAQFFIKMLTNKLKNIYINYASF